MTGFDQLFEANPVLIFFLTMIVGTGGNVGGQTVVMAVRKLALGEEVGICWETFAGLKLCAVLVPVAFIRCWAQQVSVPGSMTVAISVLAVTVIGALLGAGLPKTLFALSIDPAHATPMIQVVMDILGVCIICVTGMLLLDKNGTGEQWTDI
jgi:Mg/Co/Ni transporter MgtE